MQQFRPTCCPVRCLRKIPASKRGGEKMQHKEIHRNTWVSVAPRETFSDTDEKYSAQTAGPLSHDEYFLSLSSESWEFLSAPCLPLLLEVVSRLSHGLGAASGHDEALKEQFPRASLSVRSLLQTFSLTWFFFASGKWFWAIQLVKKWVEQFTRQKEELFWLS